MDRLPKPATLEELRERIHDLEGVFAADGWEGVLRSQAERDSLFRYAVGEISITQLRTEVGRTS